jgi:hypothetical protein
MKVQDWIFSIRYWTHTAGSALRRHAVVGPARSSTVEAALHLAGVPEAVRAQIRANDVVCDFVEGRLDPDATGYHVTSFPIAPCCADDETVAWMICIGSVQEILPR